MRTVPVPVVSVIVPNYNHARFLEQRLESIFNQTYQDFEVIILDDCSTDNSLDIIEQYRSHPKVAQILVNTENSGSTFRQWNKGIGQARGEYIWIAESDDWADKHLLETLVPGLKYDSEVGLAFCQSWQVDEEGAKLEDRQATKQIFEHNFIMEGHSFVTNYMVPSTALPNASAIVFRKDIYIRVEFAPQDLKLCGDWLMWIRMLSHASICYKHAKLNYFRQHNRSVRQGTPWAVAANETLQVAGYILKHFKYTHFNRRAYLYQLTHLFLQSAPEQKVSFKRLIQVIKLMSLIDDQALFRVFRTWAVLTFQK